MARAQHGGHVLSHVKERLWGGGGSGQQGVLAGSSAEGVDPRLLCGQEGGGQGTDLGCRPSAPDPRLELTAHE